VLSQRRLPDELIFVDDHSTDESISVAQSLLSNFPAAKFVENPTQLGTIGALNVGLREARSKYVLFLSSNDFILPDLLARAADCVKSIATVGVWSAMTWVVEEHRGYWLYPSPVIARKDAFFSPAACRRLAYRFGNWFTTMVFNRAALLEIGGFDKSLEGLTDLFAGLVLASRYGAAFSPAPLRTWRIHENSLLSRTLCNNQTLHAVVKRFTELGEQLAPELFTPSMVTRTKLRLCFASLRASNGGTLPYVISQMHGLRRTTTKVVAPGISRKLRKLSLGVIFAVMRPFDLLPMVWYRLLGSSIVRFREFGFAFRRKHQPALQS
jgi:hypothetical protein